MRDFYVFDIPVYLCTEKAYYADMKTGVTRELDTLALTGVPREKAPDVYRSTEEHFRAKFGGPWDFNQVVGWVRLYAEGSHVGGHLWWVNARRLQRHMRKTFYLTSSSNVLPTYFTLQDNSTKIFDETLALIENLARERLKGRHMDLRTFRNVGPFINWRALLDAAAKKSG